MTEVRAAMRIGALSLGVVLFVISRVLARVNRRCEQ